MPYDPDTKVPMTLLRILEARVGHRHAAILLHDHLDNPEDQVTKAELAFAIGGTVSIKRELGRKTQRGYRAKTHLEFQTRLSERQWDGTRLEVPIMPETLRAAIPGKPLNQVVDHPLLGDERIHIISERRRPTDGKEDTRSVDLVVDAPMTRMKTIRPPWPIRLLTGVRRHLRWSRAARELNAHVGSRLWTPLAAAMGAFIGMLTTEIVMFALLSPWMGSTKADHFATPTALASIPLAFVATWWFMTGLSDKEDVVKNHAEAVMKRAKDKGLP